MSTEQERPAPVDLFDAIGPMTPETARRVAVLLGLNWPKPQQREAA
jgi:hypothetical protein